MKVKALKGFSGTISMHEGEVRELNRTETVNELIRIGYLEETAEGLKSDPEKAEAEVKTDENKRGKSKRN